MPANAKRKPGTRAPRVFSDTAEAGDFLRGGSAVAIGNYDGVHLGHQAILKGLARKAAQLKVKSVVLTFSPHPVKVLAPAAAPKLLFTDAQKVEFLSRFGIDAVVLQKFDARFAKIPPEDFFTGRLAGDLRARAVFVGYDFTFGAGRSGTAETLEDLGRRHGVEVTVVSAQMAGGTLASSSLVRKLLGEGNVRLAAELLTRPFFVDGSVVKGHKRGTALGIHTANLAVRNETLPLDGVYATFFAVDGKTYPSVTNVGFNPTFHNEERSVETHIFGFDGDLYGRGARLFFIERLRGEIQFASPEALVLQIRKDIEAAKAILKKEAKPA